MRMPCMPGPGSFRPGIMLFGLIFFGFSQLGFSEPVAQKREEFTVDPGWETFSSRQPPAQWPQIKQDFGWDAARFPTTGSAGQIGGLISRTTVPASYSRVLPEKNLNQPLRASGKFRVARNLGNSGVL